MHIKLFSDFNQVLVHIKFSPDFNKVMVGWN